jgi:hypothetical protein
MGETPRLGYFMGLAITIIMKMICCYTHSLVVHYRRYKETFGALNAAYSINGIQFIKVSSKSSRLHISKVLQIGSSHWLLL